MALNAHFIGYEFKHHDAVEDAAAAAEVVLAACREQGVDIEHWVRTSTERISTLSCQKVKKKPASHSRDGHPDGEFYGEVLVFTGGLQMIRDVAADYAAFMGCKVNTSLSGKTTILVSGIQTSPAINHPQARARNISRLRN